MDLLTPWYEDRSNLQAVAQYLEDNGGEPCLTEFLDEPWKWTGVWEEMMRRCEELGDAEDPPASRNLN